MRDGTGGRDPNSGSHKGNCRTQFCSLGSHRFCESPRAPPTKTGLGAGIPRFCLQPLRVLASSACDSAKTAFPPASSGQKLACRVAKLSLTPP